METKFLKNEIITGLAIYSIVSEVKEIELVKVMLIAPLLSYSSVVDFLKNKNTKSRSIEELMLKRKITFANFNKRFYDNLSIGMNSIMLFVELGLISINENVITTTDRVLNLSKYDIGKRSINIVNASHKLAEILKKEDASDLYLSLRIKL